MLILRLALRAIRWRVAASVTVFVVAIVAILAATVGPIYLRAVDQAVLARHLSDATPLQRNLLVSRNTEFGYSGMDWDAEVQYIAGQFGHRGLFTRPITEKQATVNFGGPEPLRSELASIQDLCSHVRIVSGRCVSGSSTSATVISANTAAVEHLSVGDTLATSTPSGVPIKLRIVGVYRPVAPSGSFWQPWNLFEFGQPGTPFQPPPGDAAFVTSAALSSLVDRVPETISANLVLRSKGVRYDDIGRLRTMIAHANATITKLSNQTASSGLPDATIITSLPTILHDVDRETSLARTLVTITTAQLALLAILLLYAVVANTAAAQGPEVALAKLRGRRTGSILLQSVAQPVVLVLAAAPVAALLAWVVVRLFAADLLGAHVDVTFPPAAYGVAALAVAGGILAAVIAAHRILVTPVQALMRRGGARPGSQTGLLIADAAAVTIAVAGLVELEAGGVLDSGKPNPLSVLAPTLLAVGAAIVVLRLLPLLARRLTRWTRDSRRLATFLAVRQLLRRPTEARAVLMVAVAVSIATFAVALWAGSRHNRSLRALNSAGAETVLDVRLGAGVYDLRTVVDRADPSGNSMAVAYTKVPRLPPLIAVDTTRFAAVGAWVSGNSSTPLPAVLRHLDTNPMPVTVTGTRLRLRIDLRRHPAAPVHLTVNLAEPNHNRTFRTIGPVVPGTTSYDVSLPPKCASGCRIDGLQLTANTPDTPITPTTRPQVIDAVVGASARSGRGWRPVPSFADRTRWTGDNNGPVSIHTAGRSLSLTVYQNPGAVWPAVVSTAIPTSIPAVIASTQAAAEEGSQIHNVEAVGLDRLALSVDGVIRSVTLPQIGRDGIMIDFETALAAMQRPAATSTHYEVWLSPRAPADMRARLARRHVYVQRTVRAATYRAALDHSGPGAADSMFLLSALAAIVLAIGATAVGRVLSVRRRGYELAALEAVGVSPRTLRRATAAEQGSVFGIGLLVGLAAGLVGSWLALPSTPIFIDTATGPPLVLGLPWGLLALLTLGMVVLFVAVSVAITIVVERVATPSQLRMAQE